jgi:predicted AAA+ superfamily ATPase
MAHPRYRHIVSLLMKKLSFNPVLAIQGARQTGKSFLVRDLLSEHIRTLKYVTLDDYALREFIQTNPDLFLSQYPEALPLAIDEAQKSPKLFDAIKLKVDQKKTRGKFLLLGSTEFSKLNLIREALTGRMSRIRLFPLNIAETLALPPSPSKSLLLVNETPRFTRTQFMKYLNHGGMPGIFSVRDTSERESLLRDWIELTARRDALLFPKIKIDADLCLRILGKIATLEEPDAGSIAKSLKRDLRRIKTHLEALVTLFALHPLDPHPSGTGKRIYFLCDVAFAKILGASLERQMHTWLLQEQLSERAYRDDRESRLFYYRTPKGSKIHLIVESGKKIAALKVLSEEKLNEKELEILKAFRTKNSIAKPLLYALGAHRVSDTKNKIEIYPWEAIG